MIGIFSIFSSKRRGGSEVRQPYLRVSGIELEAVSTCFSPLGEPEATRCTVTDEYVPSGICIGGRRPGDDFCTRGGGRDVGVVT